MLHVAGYHLHEAIQVGREILLLALEAIRLITKSIEGFGRIPLESDHQKAADILVPPVEVAKLGPPVVEGLQGFLISELSRLGKPGGVDQMLLHRLDQAKKLS